MAVEVKEQGGKLFHNGKEVALVENINKGLATAYIRWDENGNVIGTAFNATVARVGLGIFLITFDTPMDNTDFITTASTRYSTTDISAIQGKIGEDEQVRATTQIRVVTGVISSAIDVLIDNPFSSIVVHGGKN